MTIPYARKNKCQNLLILLEIILAYTCNLAHLEEFASTFRLEFLLETFLIVFNQPLAHPLTAVRVQNREKGRQNR